MPGGKKYGKPKPQPASTERGASSPGHPVRLIADRIYAIGKEIRETVAAIRDGYGWVEDEIENARESARRGDYGDLFTPQEIREGDSASPGNE